MDSRNTTCTLGEFEFGVSRGPHDAFWRDVEAGRWEPQTFAVFRRYISPQTTVLDVGAWIGPTALYASKLARRVYAFEPDPVARAELEQNILLNGASDKIEVIAACITEHGGKVRLRTPSPGDSLSSLVLHDSASKGFDTPSMTLSGFLETRSINDPMFIKVDVEGYEFELCPALSQVLHTRRATLHLSLHTVLVAANRWPGQDVVSKILRRITAAALVMRLMFVLRGLRVTDAQGAAVGPIAAVARALQARPVTVDNSLVACAR
jgi:FkbM family methyltransferase